MNSKRNKTRLTLVYDLPLRFFHWIFALSFVGAFSIGKLMDDESPRYPYHMILGLGLASIVILRLIWGFLGSRYSRFSSFSLKPKDLLSYFQNLLSKKPAEYVGHNPASSWSGLVMMALGLGLAATGLLMTAGEERKAFKEIHEVLGNGFALVALAHVAGIVFHTIRHRDAIGLSMMDGKKKTESPAAGIQSREAAAWVGVLFLVLSLGIYFSLFKSYDPQTQTVKIFGSVLRLGEASDH